VTWYRDRLGLMTLFDAPFTDPEPRANNFSVPANLATSLVRRAAVLQPLLPGEDGRVELMQFEGFDGRDYSAHAAPPNLGIISVRYPVRDLSAYTLFLEANGIAPVYAATGVAIAGTGTADLVAVRDPDGSLTEFYHAR
jgi:catechol 2,3-dioxygenase-like lactoylglutathione lyase family enzyme